MRQLIALVSLTSPDPKQRSDQRRALALLEAKGIRPKEVRGDDPGLVERRNQFFEASGLRGKYPQFFLVDDEEGTETIKFLGQYAELETLAEEEQLDKEALGLPEEDPEDETPFVGALIAKFQLKPKPVDTSKYEKALHESDSSRIKVKVVPKPVDKSKFERPQEPDTAGSQAPQKTGRDIAKEKTADDATKDGDDGNKGAMPVKSSPEAKPREDKGKEETENKNAKVETLKDGETDEKQSNDTAGGAGAPNGEANEAQNDASEGADRIGNSSVAQEENAQGATSEDEKVPKHIAEIDDTVPFDEPEEIIAESTPAEHVATIPAEQARSLEEDHNKPQPEPKPEPEPEPAQPAAQSTEATEASKQEMVDKTEPIPPAQQEADTTTEKGVEIEDEQPDKEEIFVASKEDLFPDTAQEQIMLSQSEQAWLQDVEKADNALTSAEDLIPEDEQKIDISLDGDIEEFTDQPQTPPVETQVNSEASQQEKLARDEETGRLTRQIETLQEETEAQRREARRWRRRAQAAKTARADLIFHATVAFIIVLLVGGGVASVWILVINEDDDNNP